MSNIRLYSCKFLNQIGKRSKFLKQIESLPPGLVSMCECLNRVQTYVSTQTCLDWQKFDPAPKPGTCPAYLKLLPTPSDVSTFLSLSLPIFLLLLVSILIPIQTWLLFSPSCLKKIPPKTPDTYL